MAIVPLLANLARELDNDFEHYWDDDFGFGLHPVDIFRPTRHNHSLLLHPRRRLAPYDRSQMLARRASLLGKDIGDGSPLIPTVGKDGFQVCMDVSQFKPKELTVKTVDKTVIVEGKHEEREDDHGLIQRHFIRKYTLPKDYDPKDVVSTISSDGVLTVKAPPPPSKAIKANERIVQIQQTGPAHLSVKAPEEAANEGKPKENGDKKSAK
ncbi:heat shock protein 27-like [Rhagoletis pomonella]|uniref:heat shock protein 27-like n=2 Tax=Rhagoletis pomonella TaxID=28610 RepID=UPI00177EE356|nr:heat shock protein 27-like [Rhagoletis pomonella]